MGDFAPWNVAETLFGFFFPRRGLRPAAPLPPRAEFAADLERRHYARFDARRAAPRGGRDLVAVFVLEAGGEHARFSPKFRALLDAVGREAGAERLDEVIFVADPAFFGQGHIVEALAAAQRRHAPGGDPEGEAPFYNAFPYENFVCDLPAHVSVALHEVLSPGEEAEVLADLRLARSALPVIFHNDPPLVWAGARAGQVVRITADSLTAGTEISYRRVEQGPLVRW